MCREENSTVFCTVLTIAAKAEKHLLHQHHEPNKPTKERPLFISFSTVSRGHPSLVSLGGILYATVCSPAALSSMILINIRHLPLGKRGNPS